MVTSDYDIVVDGELPLDYASCFPQLEMTIAPGRTTLHARNIDQAALHGVLARIASLGLTLLSLSVEGEWPEPP